MLALSAALGTTIGDSTASTVNNVGQTRWNYLTHRQLQEKTACYGTAKDCADHIAKYDKISKEQDERLKAVCSSNPNSTDCQRMMKDALEYVGENRNHYGKASDIKASTKRVLNVANSTGYHTIDTLNERANYFGAMYGYTGQPWFRVAEDVSREDLQGWIYSAGNMTSDLYGPPLDNWRDEAGTIIMKNGKADFQDIYKNPKQSYQWSVTRLHNEQYDSELQAVHEKWYRQWNVVVRKIADFKAGGQLQSPKDRINTGCDKMSEVQECKVQQ
ncbi:hypothetical protein SAMN02745664_1366 [Moraxella cuniculi DSM 21768]|uniref:DUF6862 domain-containing protein n=2 Tax=Moraxella cuniculi TaxID=34061 RepID=A0A1N7GC75_9GAMM|nr:hypothetical protein SAMN02745664_1366 [Moraxella cuniculi DSM 21768]